MSNDAKVEDGNSDLSMKVKSLGFKCAIALVHLHTVAPALAQGAPIPPTPWTLGEVIALALMSDVSVATRTAILQRGCVDFKLDAATSAVLTQSGANAIIPAIKTSCYRPPSPYSFDLSMTEEIPTPTNFEAIHAQGWLNNSGLCVTNHVTSAWVKAHPQSTLVAGYSISCLERGVASYGMSPTKQWDGAIASTPSPSSVLTAVFSVLGGAPQRGAGLQLTLKNKERWAFILDQQGKVGIYNVGAWKDVPFAQANRISGLSGELVQAKAVALSSGYKDWDNAVNQMDLDINSDNEVRIFVNGEFVMTRQLPSASDGSVRLVSVAGEARFFRFAARIQKF